MNILIENAESLEYFTNGGTWTKHAAEAKNFWGTQDAFETATRAPIGRFNIVCHIPQSRHFIIINMNRGTGQGASTTVRDGRTPALPPLSSQRASQLQESIALQY